MSEVPLYQTLSTTHCRLSPALQPLRRNVSRGTVCPGALTVKNSLSKAHCPNTHCPTTHCPNTHCPNTHCPLSPATLPTPVADFVPTARRPQRHTL